MTEDFSIMSRSEQVVEEEVLLANWESDQTDGHYAESFRDLELSELEIPRTV